jgi:ATP synthase protein I
MQEYYQLQQELLLSTLAISGIIFISVWVFYSLNVALNYLIGACTCVVYLRMLAKDVERLGGQNNRLSKSRFALFIGLIIIATQVNKLQILPIFLGFLTYKAAILVYMLRTLLLPDNR